jgi:hypothetical protein
MAAAANADVRNALIKRQPIEWNVRLDEATV